MKVYVIKNKEGEYFDDFQDFETNNICDARLFDTYEEALSFCPKNCDGDVVKFILVEGDLEQELAIYKQALKLACENIRDMYCSDYCARTRDERCKEICYYEQCYDKEKFLDQAKEELEKENKDERN